MVAIFVWGFFGVSVLATLAALVAQHEKDLKNGYYDKDDTHGYGGWM
jgi:hypothetical protein